MNEWMRPLCLIGLSIFNVCLNQLISYYIFTSFLYVKTAKTNKIRISGGTNSYNERLPVVERVRTMDVYQQQNELVRQTFTSGGTNSYNGRLTVVEQVRTVDVYQWWNEFVQWTFTSSGMNSYNGPLPVVERIRTMDVYQWWN